MKFCTVINCMDGQVQLPVIKYMQTRFKVEFVDSITEPGPNRILAMQSDSVLLQSILTRLKISIEKSNSVGIAVVGHHDCTGNPGLKEEQVVQIQKAVKFLQQRNKKIEVIGLWVDENWNVNEI